MRLFNRKSQLQRFLESVDDSLGRSRRAQVRPAGGRLEQGTEGGPDRGRRPGRPHGGERRHLVAQAAQGGGGRRFVKLASVAVFAAGYIAGARAGHERYAQIVDAVEKASQRLEEFSSRHPPGRQRQPVASGAR